MNFGSSKRVLNFYDLMLYVALVRKYLRLMALLILHVPTIWHGRLRLLTARLLLPLAVMVDSLSLPLDTDKVFHDSTSTM